MSPQSVIARNKKSSWSDLFRLWCGTQCGTRATSPAFSSPFCFQGASPLARRAPWISSHAHADGICCWLQGRSAASGDPSPTGPPETAVAHRNQSRALGGGCGRRSMRALAVRSRKAENQTDQAVVSRMSIMLRCISAETQSRLNRPLRLSPNLTGSVPAASWAGPRQGAGSTARRSTHLTKC